MITKFKIYESKYKSNEEMANDPDFQQLIANSKREPKLKIGDILDLSDDYMEKGARHFAEVIKVFPDFGIARVKNIRCSRKPYLCNTDHISIVDCFDDSKLADMELFKSKMRSAERNISEYDPYGEEIWDDDYRGEDSDEMDRIIAVHVFDKNSAANYTGYINFVNDDDEMNTKINDVIEESEFRKVYIECESNDFFTEDELVFLDELNINFN